MRGAGRAPSATWPPSPVTPSPTPERRFTMRYRVIVLALAAGWFSFSAPMATAQPSPPPLPKTSPDMFTGTRTVVDAKAVWEDVEIFRRILDRAVTPWTDRSNAGENWAALIDPDGLRLHLADFVKHGTAGFAQPNLETLAYWTALRGARHAPVEGNYLSGYGVVFTA